MKNKLHTTDFTPSPFENCSIPSPSGRVREGLWLKNLTLLLTIFLASIFTNAKAQDDDPFCGWYVDGVKTDKIDCYSFGELHIVVPYNSSYSGFDQVHIAVYLASDKNGTRSVNRYVGTAINTFKKGKYLVFRIFKKGEDFVDMKGNKYREDEIGQLNRYNMAFKGGKKGKPAPDEKMFANLWGCTINGYEMAFDNACNCEKRKPILEEQQLGADYILTLTNRISSGAFSNDKVDMSAACSVIGTKVDFNTLK